MAPAAEPARQKYFMELVKARIAELAEEKGRPLTCFISTFGCQMNAFGALIPHSIMTCIVSRLIA